MDACYLALQKSYLLALGLFAVGLSRELCKVLHEFICVALSLIWRGGGIILFGESLSLSLHKVDGYIARRFSSQLCLLGSALDPLADKCLASVLFVTLSMVDLILC